MKAKIGINGLGRIGRMVVRSIFEEKHKNLKINHINNRADIRTACELIKRDSIHGKFKGKVSVKSNSLMINGNKITYSQKNNIDDISWKKHNVDIVLECTGKFNSKEKLITHIKRSEFYIEFVNILKENPNSKDHRFDPLLEDGKNIANPQNLYYNEIPRFSFPFIEFLSLDIHQKWTMNQESFSAIVSVKLKGNELCKINLEKLLLATSGIFLSLGLINHLPKLIKKN